MIEKLFVWLLLAMFGLAVAAFIVFAFMEAFRVQPIKRQPSSAAIVAFQWV